MYKTFEELGYEEKEKIGLLLGEWMAIAEDILKLLMMMGLSAEDAKKMMKWDGEFQDSPFFILWDGWGLLGIIVGIPQQVVKFCGDILDQSSGFRKKIVTILEKYPPQYIQVSACMRVRAYVRTGATAQRYKNVKIKKFKNMKNSC